MAPVRHSKQKWLQGAYRVLTALGISIENHAKHIGIPGFWANFFHAFVCGLFLRVDITMVTCTGQNPVNLNGSSKFLCERLLKFF
jgi:hypothetical protein